MPSLARLGVAGSIVAALLSSRPAPAAAADPAPTADPAPAEALLPVDAFAAQREALFDLAFKALVAGDLDRAERAFAAAASLGGDAAARAVAASFAARVRALRAARAAPSPPQSAAPGSAESDNSGHIPFLLTTTAFGLGVYGWTLPGLLGVRAGDSPRTFVGLYMLAGASGFFAPFLLTKGEPLSAGAANLAFYGGTRGIIWGFLAASLIAGDDLSGRHERAFAGSLLAGSLLGLAGGAALARGASISAGHAHTVGVMGDFGMFLGLDILVLAGLNGTDLSNDEKARRISAAVLLGGAGATLGGYRLARARDNTWGDAEVMRAGGAFGLLAGVTFADELRLHDRGAAAVLLAGTVGGVVAGDRLTVNTNFSVGQSLLVDLSGIAGGLAATGLLYLFSPRDWSERPYLLAATLGAGAGLGVTYHAFKDRGVGGASARGAAAAAPPSMALLPMLGPGLRGAAVAGGF